MSLFWQLMIPLILYNGVMFGLALWLTWPPNDDPDKQF